MSENIDANDLDLDALEEQTGTIAANLDAIRKDETDLDTLDEQTGNIVSGLRYIEKNCPLDSVLDDLEEQLDRIIEKLERVNQLRETTDV
jgi:hypothetical protein